MLRTWSAYQSYRKQHPDVSDPLMEFHSDLKEALDFRSHDERFRISWSLSLILARDPIKAGTSNEWASV
jgi:hypothetical protein